METLAQILEKHNLRTTAPRQIIFQTLQENDEAVDIATLIHHCPTVDRVTLYRTLETFHAIGLVEIVHIGWKKRYELAAPHKPHHHHLHCTTCQKLIEIDSPQLEDFITCISTQHKFQPQSHTFEINGLCQNCQETSRA